MGRTPKTPARIRGPAGKGHRIAGAPTRADEQRLREARMIARAQAATIDSMARAMRKVAFQAELTAAVRAASPFLIGLLESEGHLLAEAIPTIEPMANWPRRPRLAANTTTSNVKGHSFRHIAAAHHVKSAPWPGFETHGMTIMRDGGGFIRVEVVGHSLEVFAEIGGVRFRSRYGTLVITLPHNLPDTLAVGCVGRSIEDVVDHAALRGRGWTIKDISGDSFPYAGALLTVETGSVRFRIV